MQQLSGRVDTLQNQVDTQNAATQKAIGDLNFKVTGSAAHRYDPERRHQVRRKALRQTLRLRQAGPNAPR